MNNLQYKVEDLERKLNRIEEILLHYKVMSFAHKVFPEHKVENGGKFV